MSDKSDKEKFDGLVNECGPASDSKLEIVSVSSTGHHVIYRAIDRSEYEALTIQNQEAELNHKKAIVALYLATVLSLAAMSFDIYLNATHGVSYKTPDWVLAIISSVYLGAGTNQILAFVKAIRTKK